MEALRKEGYTIDSAPNRGLPPGRPPPAVFPPRKLLPGGRPPLGGLVRVLDSVDSTNNLAQNPGRSGAPVGTVIVADSQTGGRGRMGRSFVSPPGVGVYLSVILRPEAPPEELMHLTCAVAEVLCDGIEVASGLRQGSSGPTTWYPVAESYAAFSQSCLWRQRADTYSTLWWGQASTATRLSPIFHRRFRDMAGSLSMLTGKAVSRNTLAAEMIRALSRLDGDLVENRQGVDGPVPPGLCHHRPGRQREPGGRNPVGGRRWTWTTGALFWWISARGRRPSSPAKSVYAVCMGTYNVSI